MRAALALALVLLAASAMAQDRMDRATCAETFDFAFGLARMDTPTAEIRVDDDGWCRAEGALLGEDDLTAVRLGQIRWRALGLARFIETGQVPSVLELEVRDIGMVTTTGDPVLDYALSIQQGDLGWEFDMVVRWDALQKTVFLDRLDLRMSEGNGIGLRGTVAGLDLTDQAAYLRSLDTAGLGRLALDVEFGGWFETYAVMVAADALLDDGPPSPAEQVEALKTQAQGAVSALPETFIAQPGKDALSALIRSLPQPRGRLRLTLEAAEPIGMARLLPLREAGIEPTAEVVLGTLMEGTTVTITWEPR